MGLISLQVTNLIHFFKCIFKKFQKKNLRFSLPLRTASIFHNKYQWRPTTKQKQQQRQRRIKPRFVSPKTAPLGASWPGVEPSLSPAYSPLPRSRGTGRSDPPRGVKMTVALAKAPPAAAASLRRWKGCGFFSSLRPLISSVHG